MGHNLPMNSNELVSLTSILEGADLWPGRDNDLDMIRNVGIDLNPDHD